MNQDDLSRITWFKSTYSNGQGGNCTECAKLPNGYMAVRDSKNSGNGPTLVFGREQWSAFLASLR